MARLAVRLLNAKPRLPDGPTLLALLVALCFLAGAVGWRLGSGRPPGEGTADVGFLHDMVVHHTQATDMARIALLNGTDLEVRRVAEEVDRFQSYELGLMDRMLDEWGYAIEDAPDTAMAWMGDPHPMYEMPGLATDEEMEVLRFAGAATDETFLALLIDHHASAVGMAEAAADRADDTEVRALAARIAKAQRYEIAELRALTRRLGLDDTPAGVTYEVFDPVAGRIREHGGSH